MLSKGVDFALFSEKVTTVRENFLWPDVEVVVTNITSGFVWFANILWTHATYHSSSKRGKKAQQFSFISDEYQL